MRIELKAIIIYYVHAKHGFWYQQNPQFTIKNQYFSTNFTIPFFGLEIQGIFRLVHPVTCWSKRIKH